MERYQKTSPINGSLPEISARRNVVTSLSRSRSYAQRDPRKRVNRAQSELPYLQVSEGDVSNVVDQRATRLRDGKHGSPIPPSTTPLPQESYTIQEEDPRIQWKDFLSQMNSEKKAAPRRTGWDDVRLIEYKYARCHNHFSQQVPPSPTPVHASTPVNTHSTIKYAASPTRLHRLKPIFPTQRHKYLKKHRPGFLGVSGHGLMCQLTEKSSYKDYTPGLVKKPNHECFRCLYRMSTHDHHSQIAIFNSACRARKFNIKESNGTVLESIVCMNKNKEYLKPTGVIPSRASQTTIIQRSSSLSGTMPYYVSEEMTHFNQRAIKLSNKQRRLLRPGRIIETRENIKGDLRHLKTIMVTKPITVQFLKALELPQYVKEVQSLTLAIECGRKKKQNEKRQDETKSEDVIVASSFTMITQTQSINKLCQDQVENRECSFSVMDEASNLFRPDSITSVHEGQTDDKNLPVVVYSETATQENKDGQLNKNTSANTESDNDISGGIDIESARIDAEASSTLKRPDYTVKTNDCIFLTDVLTSSDKDPILTILHQVSLSRLNFQNKASSQLNINTSAKDDEVDSSCYWISASGVSNRALLPGETLSKSNRQQTNKHFYNTSEKFCRDEEDPDLEEDDDEGEDEGDMFYKFRSYPKEFGPDNFVLPSGKALCYTAMTDKRYNKWSRQKRKAKKKSKRREKDAREDKCRLSPGQSFSAMQEAYLKSIEVIYGQREGIIKYKHEKTREVLSTNTIVISKPEMLSRTVDVMSMTSNSSSGCSEKTSPSIQCIAPASSLAGISNNQQSLSENKLDDDTDDEIKLLCASSNSDQFESHCGRCGSPFKTLPTKSMASWSRCTKGLHDRELSSALEITRPFEKVPEKKNGRNTACDLLSRQVSDNFTQSQPPSQLSSAVKNYCPFGRVSQEQNGSHDTCDNLQDIFSWSQLATPRHPHSKMSVKTQPSEASLQTSVDEDDGGLPEIVSPSKVPSDEQLNMSTRGYISRVQKQNFNCHKRDLFNENSLLCPLAVNLPIMDVRVGGKGQCGEVKSAPPKSTRLDKRKKSGYIPRNHAALRASEDSLLPVCRGKKAESSLRRTKTKASKRRGAAAEDTESITIHDLLNNLNTNDPYGGIQQRSTQNKSPCRDQTFKEIYGRSRIPNGSTRHSPDRQARERSLSSLSISKSVTFSVLPLPDVYKIDRYKK